MDTNLKKLDDQLNAAILAGTGIQQMHRFYHEDCTMQENHDAPCVGLKANLEREAQFMASVEAFHGAELIAQAVGDDVTMTEWHFDITFKGAPRTAMQQVAVRRWHDGKIVAERFYHT